MERALEVKVRVDRTQWIMKTQGIPDSSVGKESACNAGDPGSIPWLGRSDGEGLGFPLQFSCASLMAQLWRICLHCRRPGFDLWFGKMPWIRERLPTPVFWPGEFHELYSHKELDTTWRLSLSLYLVTFTFWKYKHIRMKGTCDSLSHS